MELYIEREYRDGKLISQKYGIADASGKLFAEDTSLEGIAETMRYLAFNVYDENREFHYTNKKETSIDTKTVDEREREVIVRVRTGFNDEQVERIAKYVSTDPRGCFEEGLIRAQRLRPLKL